MIRSPPAPQEDRRPLGGKRGGGTPVEVEKLMGHAGMVHSFWKLLRNSRSVKGRGKDGGNTSAKDGLPSLL